MILNSVGIGLECELAAGVLYLDCVCVCGIKV